MKYGVDSAYPAQAPSGLVALGWTVAFGYIGGRALHVWTPDDWKRHADAGMELGPIWVSPTGDPSYQRGVHDGDRALEAMQLNGLSGVCIADVENGAVPRDWNQGFLDALHAGQCSEYLYGSRSTLVALQSDNWWLAEWITPSAPLHRAPLDWAIWQYATGPQFDYNVLRDDVQLATYQPS